MLGSVTDFLNPVCIEPVDPPILDGLQECL